MTVSPLRQEEGKTRFSHRKNYLESSISGQQRKGTFDSNQEVYPESASSARTVTKSLGLSEKPVQRVCCLDLQGVGAGILLKEALLSLRKTHLTAQGIPQHGLVFVDTHHEGRYLSRSCLVLSRSEASRVFNKRVQ